MNFKAEFDNLVRLDNPNYDLRGVLAGSKVYPLGTDTKVLSSIFEMLVRPLIHTIAERHDLRVREPSSQTVYPDFTLLRGLDDEEKIAVDVKSTYRRYNAARTSWTAKFTLGSYTSFIRNGTKNIEFPLSNYKEHWIVGFIYTRDVAVAQEVVRHSYALDEVESIACPIRDVVVFCQEKYKIASKRPGSGNTANIGSISGSSIDVFAKGEGPFAAQGESAFLDYWRDY